MLAKEVLSTILKVFGMNQPGIEPRSSRPLANALPTSRKVLIFAQKLVPEAVDFVSVFLHLITN